MRRPPDPRSAAAPGEGGERSTSLAGDRDSIPQSGRAASDSDLDVDEAQALEARIEGALDSWRRSAPQLAELTDGELLAVALTLADLETLGVPGHLAQSPSPTPTGGSISTYPEGHSSTPAGRGTLRGVDTPRRVGAGAAEPRGVER